MPWSIEDKVVFYSRSIRGAHLRELGSRCTTKLTILSLKLGRRCIELHYGTVLGGTNFDPVSCTTFKWKREEAESHNAI